MKARSFQLHLTLLAASISGAILLVFGWSAWLYVHHQWQNSVDARIQVSADRASRGLHPLARFGRVEEDWEQSWGGPREDFPRVLAIFKPPDEIIYHSYASDWLTNELLAPYLPTALPPDGLRRPRPRDRPGSNIPLKPVAKFTVTSPDGAEWRMIALANRGIGMVTGNELSGFEAELAPARNFFLTSIPFGMVAVALGGWLVGRRALRPLQRISTTAAHVTASDLAERIPTTGREYTEFSSLIGTLNAMIARLEKSFGQATRFTADASHELKTPIAIMQAEIESALRTCAPDSGEETTLLSLASETQRLKRITQSLLLLSQVDAGHLRLSKKPFDLSADITSLCEDAEHLCGEKSLSFSHSIAPDITVDADHVLIRQATQNLLTNAIKYNAESGSVSLTLTTSADSACLTFSNTGPGIPDTEREKIFDRFYRIDTARNRTTDGFGLGLNLAAEIAKAHGGSLELTPSETGLTTFTLTLPKIIVL
ncbi:MAG: ATP-binding protein [Verrucomicrobiales bacterium]|nr:ATP-binding protein [Verrucomicrobiales bacterium]